MEKELYLNPQELRKFKIKTGIGRFLSIYLLL